MPRQGGLAGSLLRPDPHTSRAEGDRASPPQTRETRLQADPAGFPGGLPGPEVSTRAGVSERAASVRDLLGHQAQGKALTVTPCFPAEVKVVGLEGSDKLSILRGCPGLPGAAGPKGDAGVNGARGTGPGPGRVTKRPLVFSKTRGWARRSAP